MKLLDIVIARTSVNNCQYHEKVKNCCRKSVIDQRCHPESAEQ